MLKSLLGPEVLASLIVAGGAAFGVSVVLRYIRDRDKLNRTVRQVDRRLERLRKGIAEKQGRMKQLEEELEILKPLYDRLNRYREQLRELDLEAERKAAMEEGDNDEDNEWGRQRRHRVDR